MLLGMLLGKWLYVVGIIGVMKKKENHIVMLMCLEVMMLGVMVDLVEMSIKMEDKYGEIISLVLILVIGSETAVGLGLIVLYYKEGV